MIIAVNLTRDLRDTGAMLYQLSYEATHWERGQFIEFISPVRSEMMCGFIAQLVEHRTGIAEVTGSNPIFTLTFSRHFHGNFYDCAYLPLKVSQA